MFTKLRSRAQSDEGFTLIELLVVILIIGILAAIALPAFLGQRQKAQDTNAKPVVRNAATAAETFYTDPASYASMDLAALRVIEPTLPTTAMAAGGLDVTVTGGGTGYTVEAASKTNSTFKIIKASDGTMTRKCTGASAGCKGGTAVVDSGTW